MTISWFPNILFLCFIAAAFLFTEQVATNILYAGQTLYEGQSISSNSGAYSAALQTDGNFVLYQNNPVVALWFTSTSNIYGNENLASSVNRYYVDNSSESLNG